ncbi:TetR/AcrR family transcriptional regulator C-terminal domain-containing protein [Yinghuangia aomiensis]
MNALALVRQVNAEIGHIPPAALKLWQETGPGRTRRELAVRLRRIAERGDLGIDDPARAAGHLMLLISADNLTDRGDVHNPDALREMVTAGVEAFLYGYTGPTGVGGRNPTHSP